MERRGLLEGWLGAKRSRRRRLAGLAREERNRAKSTRPSTALDFEPAGTEGPVTLAGPGLQAILLL